jgi:hypothetical protein
MILSTLPDLLLKLVHTGDPPKGEDYSHAKSNSSSQSSIGRVSDLSQGQLYSHIQESNSSHAVHLKGQRTLEGSVEGKDQISLQISEVFQE